ncbi:MAG TPA: hypothetical protein VKG25_22995 [Bryobacteraceae bacterium]|nr:hypothetical protein [Bryobacteraceae bacterium]
MAEVVAVVGAIARSSWRELRSLGSFQGNNLLALIVLMMAEEPRNLQSSASFYWLIIAVLFLFPLSADLLRQVPKDRLLLWPLSNGQMAAIRAATLLLNPVLWIALVVAIFVHSAMLGLMLALASFAVQLLVRIRLPRLNLLRFIGSFPSRLGGLIQNHLRVLLSALDFYFAVLFATCAAIYCFLTVSPDTMAKVVIGQLVIIFLSTLAQCQFGFDDAAERVRYRLFPLSGAEILLAKDIAWFLLAILLTWPFHFLACISSALTVLAIGHHTAVREPVRQHRWRFAEGRLGTVGLLQMFAAMSSGVAVSQAGPLAGLPFVGVYVASLWFYGRKWEEQNGS